LGRGGPCRSGPHRWFSAIHRIILQRTQSTYQ